MHVHGQATIAPPLALLASKTVLGHAEPASGLLGLAHAIQGMQAQRMRPVNHLRTVNPYVMQQLEGGRGVMIGRQQGPMSASGCAMLVGVSAFAFQVCECGFACTCKMLHAHAFVHLLSSVVP